MQILIVPVKFSLVFLITLLFLSVHMEVSADPIDVGPPPVPPPTATGVAPAAVDGGANTPAAKSVSGGKITFGSQPAPTTVIADPVGKSLMQIFQSILDVILVFAIPIVTFFIVWAGFLYVTARGDTSKIAQAHKALLYAVVGGLLVLGANVILMIIKTTIEAIVK